MIAVVIQSWANLAAAIGCFLFGVVMTGVAGFNLCRLAWRDFTEARSRRAQCFPLPVSHSRAARVVPLQTAVLLGLVLLEIGFFAGSIGFGFYLTAP